MESNELTGGLLFAAALEAGGVGGEAGREGRELSPEQLVDSNTANARLTLRTPSAFIGELDPSSASRTNCERLSRQCARQSCALGLDFECQEERLHVDGPPNDLYDWRTRRRTVE